MAGALAAQLEFARAGGSNRITASTPGSRSGRAEAHHVDPGLPELGRAAAQPASALGEAGAAVEMDGQTGATARQASRASASGS